MGRIRARRRLDLPFHLGSLTPRGTLLPIESKPTTTDPTARVDGILAVKASVAIIFRRGPSALTQQLSWNLDTDVVTPGAWIRASVYTRRCDISPNGKYLVGFFSNYSPPRMQKDAREHGLKSPRDAVAWTAISFTNSFKPLALWFQSNTYFGGGAWLANAKVEIHHPGTVFPAIPQPADIIAKRVTAPEVGFAWFARLEARGWQRIKGAKKTLSRPDIAMQWFKKTDRGHILYESNRADDSGDEIFTLCDRAGKPIRTWESNGEKPSFVEFDRRGRVIYSEDGCLYAWQNWPDEEPKLVADLRANKP